MDKSDQWSPGALKVCLFCDLIWSALLLIGCTYLVFWENQSGAWYILAIFLAACWSCKYYRSPAQIAAGPRD